MQVPYVGDAEISRRAEEFLLNNHPSLDLPIPIESIVEEKLGLFILPVKHLETHCDVAGTMSKDFKSILVDERTYELNIPRTRFTLAHEVGHFILHRDIFERENGSYDVDRFISFHNSLSEDSYRKLEIQAFLFGEALLCPHKLFVDVVQKSIDDLGGMDSLVVTDVEKIATNISEKFLISGKAAVSKLRRDFPAIIELVQANMPF